MKRLMMFTLAAGALLAFGATSVLAQGQGGTDKPRGQKMFDRVDQDGDGGVSLKEAMGNAETRFERLDANSDGNITRREFDAHMEKMKAMRQGRNPDRMEKREKMAERRFERLDANKDGKVSESEFRAGVEKRHGRMDADNDGDVTKDEVREMREKVKDRAKQFRESGGVAAE